MSQCSKWKSTLHRVFTTLLVLVLSTVGRGKSELTTTITSPPKPCPGLDTEFMTCYCLTPQTLRCKGSKDGLPSIKSIHRNITLMDLTLENTSNEDFIPNLFSGTNLSALYITTGSLQKFDTSILSGLENSLRAFGLPQNKLKRIPYNLQTFKKLQRLDLSNNQIHSFIPASANTERLTSGNPETISSLEYLDLSHNLITDIKIQCHKIYPRLEILKLNSNRLSQSDFDSTSFVCPSVKKLFLSSNNFVGNFSRSSFGVHSQSAKWSSLILLDISNNAIESILRNAFQGLKNLTSINLSHNRINLIDSLAFMGLKKLRHLDLSHNQILQISNAVFHPLSSIRNLNLAGNHIQVIEEDLLKGVVTLIHINFTDNDVRSVEANALDGLKNLTSIALQGNPLECNCDLSYLSNWLKHNRKLDQKSRQSAICTIPPQVENAKITDITLCHNDIQGNNNVDIPSPQIQLYLKAYYLIVRQDFVHVEWKIKANANTDFKCQRINVLQYENEVYSKPISCNKTMLTAGDILETVINPENAGIVKGDGYKVCLLITYESVKGVVNIMQDCTKSFEYNFTKSENKPPVKEILNFNAIMLNDTSVEVSFKAHVSENLPQCSVFFQVSPSFVPQNGQSHIGSTRFLRCNETRTILSNLPALNVKSKQSYKVCGVLLLDATMLPTKVMDESGKCFMAKHYYNEDNSIFALGLTLAFLIVGIIVLALLYVILKGYIRDPKSIMSLCVSYKKGQRVRWKSIPDYNNRESQVHLEEEFAEDMTAI